MEPVVLIVDDEKPIRDFVQKNLDVRGFRVIVASNGVDALDIFNSKNIDLVILDIMMPHLNGLETTRRIRQIDDYNVIVAFLPDQQAAHVAFEAVKSLVPDSKLRGYKSVDLLHVFGVTVRPP